MLVNTSSTGRESQSPASTAAVSSAGIVPHVSMNATSASSPPCHMHVQLDAERHEAGGDDRRG